MNIFFRAFQVLIGSLFLQTGIAYAANSCTSDSQCASGYYCSSATSRDQRTSTCILKQTSSNTNFPATTGGVCSVQFQKLMAQCQLEISATDSNCDEKANSGMSGVTSMAGQVALAFGAQSASSIQQACSSAAALSAAANAALAAYRLTCSSAIKDCNSACQAVKTYLSSNSAACNTNPSAYYSMTTQADDARRKCDTYTAKIGEAQQAMTNVAQTAANATQCASLTSADGSEALEEICKTNPTLAGCSNVLMDCNNPSMASNKVCICSKNPSDPTCTGTQSALGNSGGLGTVDNSGRLTSSASAAGIDGDIPDLPTIAQAELPSGGNEAGIDGKQGAGVSFGSSSGGAAGAGSGSGGSNPEDPNGSAVNSGFYGGSGAGGFGGGGSGEGSGGGGGLFNAAANALAAKGGPDLRQFLPGGKMAGSRGIAGATGPDGITGPNSDIWKKVQNRYQVMQPSLLP